MAQTQPQPTLTATLEFVNDSLLTNGLHDYRFNESEFSSCGLRWSWKVQEVDASPYRGVPQFDGNRTVSLAYVTKVNVEEDTRWQGRHAFPEGPFSDAPVQAPRAQPQNGHTGCST